MLGGHALGVAPMDLTRAFVNLPIETTLFVWLAVHGNLCLGLRHPSNLGPSRRYIEQFVKQLGARLVQEGFLTAEELQHAEHLERQEAPQQQPPLDPVLMAKVLSSVRLEARQPMQLRVSMEAPDRLMTESFTLEVKAGTEVQQLQQTLVSKARGWGFKVGTRFVIERLE